jgi:hypothetical protein
MNGIARVIVSVVLLGACALAMRFTMQQDTFSVAELQTYKKSVDVSKAKRLHLEIQLGDVKALSLYPRADKKIFATLSAFAADGISLWDNTDQMSTDLNRPKDTTHIQYTAGVGTWRKFFMGQPETKGVAQLYVPKNKPLSLSMYSTENANAFINLTGLTVQRFTMKPYFNNVDIALPVGSKNARFYIENARGYSSIRFNATLRGNLLLVSDTGLIDLFLNKIVRNKDIQLVVIGKATNAKAFLERLESTAQDVFWNEPTKTLNPNEWTITGYSGNRETIALFIQISLGRTAKVNIR